MLSYLDQAKVIYLECFIKEQDKIMAEIGKDIKDLEKRLR